MYAENIIIELKLPLIYVINKNSKFSNIFEKNNSSVKFIYNSSTDTFKLNIFLSSSFKFINLLLII